LSDVIRISEAKALITAGWDDVPHLSEEKKRQLLDSTPKHMRDARSKGIPSLGVGAIYPIPEEEIVCEPFAIPEYWPRAYAMDVGWKKTAVLWGAKDPSTNTIYLYAEYYKGQELPAVHAEAIKARGAWMNGCIDPAARQRNQKDGKRLMSEYNQCGLNLVTANNEVDAGIYKVYTLLTIGQLKVFRTLPNFFAEYRLYRREVKKNEYGVERAIIVKQNDHLMDDMRYLINSFDQIATTKPVPRPGQIESGAADQVVGY